MDHLLDLLASGSGLAAYAVAATLVVTVEGIVIAVLWRALDRERTARLEELSDTLERTSEALERMQRRTRR